MSFSEVVWRYGHFAEPSGSLNLLAAATWKAPPPIVGRGFFGDRGAEEKPPSHVPLGTPPSETFSGMCPFSVGAKVDLLPDLHVNACPFLSHLLAVQISCVF